MSTHTFLFYKYELFLFFFFEKIFKEENACISGTLVEILINRKPVNRDFICNIIFITEILKTYIFYWRNYINK